MKQQYVNIVINCHNVLSHHTWKSYRERPAMETLTSKQSYHCQNYISDVLMRLNGKTDDEKKTNYHFTGVVKIFLVKI